MARHGVASSKESTEFKSEQWTSALTIRAYASFSRILFVMTRLFLATFSADSLQIVSEV
jgi:hypothetical protein